MSRGGVCEGLASLRQKIIIILNRIEFCCQLISLPHDYFVIPSCSYFFLSFLSIHSSLSPTPEHLRGIRAENIFPEFREGAILRFGRLFKPVHKPSVWKGARNYRKRSKKKEDEGEEGAGKEGGGDTDGNAADDEDEDPYAWCNVKLHMPKPKPEEIGPNQMDSFCRPMTYEPSGSKDGNGDGSGNGDKRGAEKRQVAPWRYGPAQYWYDKLGIGESEEDFEEQLRRCRQVDKKEAEGNGANEGAAEAEKDNVDALIAAAKDSVAADAAAASAVGGTVDVFRYEANADVVVDDPTSSTSSMEVEYPEAAFHLITQLQWEDDIIWNGEEYRTKLYQNRHRQAAAGWVPSR